MGFEKVRSCNHAIYVDFDNCLNCWYMFELANLWIHNEGWTRRENDPAKRFERMQQCFGLQLQGYKTETEIPEEILNQLPLFIDMVLIESIPYAGFFPLEFLLSLEYNKH